MDSVTKIIAAESDDTSAGGALHLTRQTTPLVEVTYEKNSLNTFVRLNEICTLTKVLRCLPIR
jgi:hypothetical protein